MPATAATIALFGLLSAVGGGIAQKSESSKPTHAVRGVVKSINSSSLVLTVGSGKNARTMNFALTTSTRVEGDPGIGTIVAIRYRVDHRSFIATAVSAYIGNGHGPQTVPFINWN